MSKEEMNEELSTDELKDVAGGSWTVEGNLSKKVDPQWRELCDVGTSVKGNNVNDEAKWANRLTTKGKFDKGRGSFFSRGLHNNG